MQHAVIMAGGAGTRLWPLSRQKRPKQLMRLFKGASLLQLARQRLAPLFAPERTWVITSAHYLDLVASELPDLPRENLIGEPTVRDTANAVGLAAHLLARRDPEATMAVFTADHLIEPQDAFASAISTGLDAAQNFPESLVTFGVVPDSPHTGYGYVRRGEPLAPQTYRVREFKEKPQRSVAEAYLRSGEYYWNSGMFAWRVNTILKELRRHLPHNVTILEALAQKWDQDLSESEKLKTFERLEKISIDFGVMEKAEHVLLVVMDCRWVDLGSWTAIGATGERDPSGNVSLAAHALSVDGRENILISESDHLIVTLGVSNLIVVHSEDATLVCHRDAVQAIRDLKPLREARFGERFE